MPTETEQIASADIENISIPRRLICSFAETNYNTQPKLACDASFSNKFGVLPAEAGAREHIDIKIESSHQTENQIKPGISS